jgi:hypothetical protein
MRYYISFLLMMMMAATSYAQEIRPYGYDTGMWEFREYDEISAPTVYITTYSTNIQRVGPMVGAVGIATGTGVVIKKTTEPHRENANFVKA